MSKKVLTYTLLILLLVVLLFFELRFGKLKIEWPDFSRHLFDFSSSSSPVELVMKSRWIRALTAATGGCGLALSGLLMQTYFRNALAGPSVLGITSGSSLAVAVVLMFAGTGLEISTENVLPNFIVPFGAIIGAGTILILITLASRLLKSSVSLLIVGLMISYLVSALTGLLQFQASETSLKAFVVWGLGSFADAGGFGLSLIAGILMLSIAGVLVIFKHLNILLMGEAYAASMGTNVKRVKMYMIIITGMLVGTITAFCGPVAFLGLAVPHLARSAFKTSDHSVILPSSLLIGAILGLLCDFISRAPMYEGGLPLNTVTSMIGAPVVILYLLRQNKNAVYI